MQNRILFGVLLLICVAAFAMCHNAVAQIVDFDHIVLSVYVSPDGDDANPGTEARPFKTIARAQEAIRNTQTDEKGNKEVHILAGEYVLTEPLRFGPEDGGSVADQYRQVFYEGHDATITGGKRITGFREIEPGLVVANVPEAKVLPVGIPTLGQWSFRDLYVNDQRRVRARFPNEGWLRVKQAGEDRRTNFFFNDDDGIKAVRDLDKVELVFLHDWSITRTPVKSIDTEKSQLTVPIKIGAGHAFFAINGFEQHARYFLENSIEYLDAAGEWFLDTDEGKLYYRLCEGERADTIEVIAPVVTQLLVVEGTVERPVENLHFVGLHFAHAAFNEKPQKTYWGIQAASFASPNSSGDGAGLNENFTSSLPADAAVQYDFTQNCTIDHCTFRHLGENGLWLRKFCTSNIIERCLFEDIGANGVMIGTHVNSNTAKCNSMIFSTAARTGKTLYGSVGIWIGLTENSTIDRCEVFDTPYTGISLGWTWNDSPTAARENMILNCHLHHHMQMLSDGGAIYTLGRQPGSRLTFNRIHDIPANVGSAESNGMFLDEGTSEFTIDYNLITNTDRSPLRFHQAKKNLVENNFFLLETDDTPMIRYNSTPEENIELSNNATATKPDKEKLTRDFEETVGRLNYDYRTL